MFYWILETLFGIIKFIWYTPTWAVVLVIAIFSVVYFIGNLFGIFDSSGDFGNGEYGGNSNSIYAEKTFHINFDKPKEPFVFYDYSGDRLGRGDCFYDSKGYCRSWGDGFYDGKGYYRSWGEGYYDARGYFRSWGDCFYDTQGNLVHPN